jgi:hypothetical protein
MPIDRDVPFRAPSATDLGHYFAEARACADAIQRGSRGDRTYDPAGGRVGGRIAGAEEVPTRALVGSNEQRQAFSPQQQQAPMRLNELSQVRRTWK